MASERDWMKVLNLVEQLKDPLLDPDSPLDCDPVSRIKGWRVMRDGSRRGTWCVWMPESRSVDVPWALGPPSMAVNRRDLIEVLRQFWLPAAVKWLRVRE